MKKEELIEKLNECPGNPEIFFVSTKSQIVSEIDIAEMQIIKDEETDEVDSVCIALIELDNPIDN